MLSTHTTTRRSRRSQEGSAFILVLVALIVLTIFGLALAFVTQSEFQMGANDRTIGRTFYIAEAGVDITVSRALLSTNDRGPATFVIPGSMKAAGQIRDQTQMSAFIPLLAPPCNLCSINNETSYNSLWRRVNSAMRVDGARVGIGDNNKTVPLAQHTVAAMADIQPTQLAPSKPIVDPANVNGAKDWN
ncbi:MAG: pilus assembly PilX N-terminal domain-containing protein [Pseudolysinimonas sp.]